LRGTGDERDGDLAGAGVYAGGVVLVGAGVVGTAAAARCCERAAARSARVTTAATTSIIGSSATTEAAISAIGDSTPLTAETTDPRRSSAFGKTWV